MQDEKKGDHVKHPEVLSHGKSEFPTATQVHRKEK